MYSYISKDLTVQNSTGMGNQVLNEFAATVDLRLSNNTFSSTGTAGLGLDFGTGFFQITGNFVPDSLNIGMYLLYGVHDGSVTNNSISFVGVSGATGTQNSAVELLARGTQRVNISNNYLAGGAGPVSTGISVGPSISMPSLDNTISPNAFGQLWIVDYDPSNRA